MSTEIGLRLKEIRKELRLTQVQFGKKFGINGSSVAKHESGVCFPNGKILYALATKYNVSLDYLMTGKGTLLREDKENQESNRYVKILGADKELQELIAMMAIIPWVRHAVLNFFQEFKLEKSELIKKELNLNHGSSLG